MTPGLGDQALGWGQCGQIVKLYKSLKFFFYLLPYITCMAMNSSTKIVKFMAYGSGVQALGWYQYDFHL